MAINNTNLEQVGSIFTNKTPKFRGIYVNESLSLEKQLAHIDNKISRSIHVINQVKHFFPYTSTKTLYASLIHPYLSYGILAWGNAKASLLYKKQQLLHKSAIRIIYNLWYKRDIESILYITFIYYFYIILKLNDFHEI